MRVSVSNWSTTEADVDRRWRRSCGWPADAVMHRGAVGDRDGGSGWHSRRRDHEPGLNRQILRLAVPALGALLAEPTFLLVDAAIVGHLGTEQLAGVGIASVILGTLVGLSVFLAYGTTAQVARSLGAGQPDRALSFGIAGLYLAVIIGVAVLLVGWPLAPELIDWFGGGPAVSEYGITFLRWSLIGLPAMLAVLATTGVLRGLQDTRTPLLVAVIGAVVNVGLNLLLVNGFQLGVAGSAIGTVITQTGMALALVAVVVRAARRHGAPLAPHAGHIRGAGRAGIPLFIRTLTLRLAHHRHHGGRRPAGRGRAGRPAGGAVHLELPGAGPGRAGDRRAGADRQGARRGRRVGGPGADQGDAALGGVGRRRHRCGGAADPRGRRVGVLAGPGGARGGGRRR